MNLLIEKCIDVRPNITYVAIGAAYSTEGGMQQFPPFLDNLFKNYIDFTFHVILIDPLIEQVPELVRYVNLSYPNKNLSKINFNNYSSDNLTVDIIREYFDLILSLIERTIYAKKEKYNNTYLLFIHDFSGHQTNILSEYIYNFCKINFIEEELKIYQKNILIDITFASNDCCFPDLKGEFSNPIIINDENNSLFIFNPFMLTPNDLGMMFLFNYSKPVIKNLCLHIIMYKLQQFNTSILNKYILSKSKFLSTDLDKESEILFELVRKELDFLNFYDAEVIDNLMIEFSNQLFNSEDKFKLQVIFRMMMKKIKLFLSNISFNNYVNKFIVHIKKHQPFCLYIHILEL